MGQLGHCSLQCGDKELLPRRVVSLDGIVIKDVACGGVHTCALTDKGALYAWGGGQAGQLGIGPLAGLFSCKPNGSDMMLRNLPILLIPFGVRLVRCGHSHTLICNNEGRIYGWGYNNYGQAANEGPRTHGILENCVNQSNASLIEDVASRTGSDALARLCERPREHFPNDGVCYTER